MRACIGVALLGAACSAGTPGGAPGGEAIVANARIAVTRAGPPGEWPMPGGDYSNSRYSELASITPANAKQLQVSWALSTGVLRGHEGQPLVVDNTMYLVTPYPNVAYAVDLATPGQPLKWRFRPENAQSAAGRACCDVVNRGVALYRGRDLRGDWLGPVRSDERGARSRAAVAGRAGLLVLGSSKTG